MLMEYRENILIEKDIYNKFIRAKKENIVTLRRLIQTTTMVMSALKIINKFNDKKFKLSTIKRN